MSSVCFPFVYISKSDISFHSSVRTSIAINLEGRGMVLNIFSNINQIYKCVWSIYTLNCILRNENITGRIPQSNLPPHPTPHLLSLLTSVFFRLGSRPWSPDPATLHQGNEAHRAHEGFPHTAFQTADPHRRLSPHRPNSSGGVRSSYRSAVARSFDRVLFI